MKRILKMLLFFIIVILSSCSNTSSDKIIKSYDELKKIETETKSDYISFGNTGIVINGDNTKITYKEMFGIEKIYNAYAYKKDNYLYLSCSGYDFYLAKYNLLDNTYVSNKFEIGKPFDYKFIDSKYYLYCRAKSGADTVGKIAVVDLDFNILFSPEINFKENQFNYSITKYGMGSIEFDYIGTPLTASPKKIIYYDNNKFESFDINLKKYYRGLNYILIQDYCVFYTDYPTTIELIINLKNKTIAYMMDESITLDNYVKEELELDFFMNIISEIHTTPIPTQYIVSRDDILKTDFDKVIKKYCSDSMCYNYSQIITENEEVLYVIETYRKKDNIVIMASDYDGNETLEPHYIYKYDKETNSLLYAGYTMGEFIYFYLK